MAIQNPPSLQCIAPVNGVVRPYHDWAFPGGLSNIDFLQNWYENTVRRQNAFPANGPSRLVNYDMRLQLLSHPFYDDFWQIRSSLTNAGAINIPVFIADSWQQQAGIHGDLLIRQELNSISRMAIHSEPEALMLNPNFLEDDLLAFYSWCLQEESAPDFAARPPLQYQIQGQSLWQSSETWPAPQVEHISFYLNRQSLDMTEPATLATEIQQNSLGLSRYGDELDSLSFISEPLAGDLEIAGPLMLELYATSSRTDTAFSVTIEEQVDLNRLQSRFDFPGFLRNILTVSARQNSETSIIQVTQGTLKASLRQTELSSVEEMDPRYTFTTANYLRAAEVTRFNIALNPSAYRFRAGSRIIVRITQGIDDSLSTESREDSLYHSERYPSRLWLPVKEGSLATAVADEDSLPSIIDLQSEAIADPRAINFDLEFNRLLNENKPAEAPQVNEEIQDPIIFISPLPQE
jgi:predicted acyl esterase